MTEEQALRVKIARLDAALKQASTELKEAAALLRPTYPSVAGIFDKAAIVARTAE